MLELSISKKLADYMNIKPEKRDNSLSDLNHWFADVFNYSRHKTIVAIHGQTRFGVVLWGFGPTLKDFSDFGQILNGSIRFALKLYGYKEELIKDFLPDDEVVFSPSTDHKGIAAVTQMADIAQNLGYSNIRGGQVTLKYFQPYFQREWTRNLNDEWFLGGLDGEARDYGRPQDFFLKAFRLRYGEDCIDPVPSIW